MYYASYLVVEIKVIFVEFRVFDWCLFRFCFSDSIYDKYNNT